MSTKAENFASFDGVLSSIGYGTTGTALMTGNPYAIAGAAAFDTLMHVVPDIGSGRKEADILVPYQNQLGQLLEQVTAEMQNPDLGVDRLHQLREFLVAGMTAYQRVLAQPWKDGRAAKQGTDTMFGNPGYARVTLENLDKLIAGQTVGGVTNAAAAAGGGAAGGNNNLLLAGLGLGMVFFLS